MPPRTEPCRPRPECRAVWSRLPCPGAGADAFVIRSAGGIDGSGDFDATDTIRVTRDGNGTVFQTAGDPRQPAGLIGDWI